MKTWKGYNIIDLCLLMSGVIAVVVSTIIFGFDWILFIQCMLCLVTVFTQAKGKISTQFLGVITFIFYIFISYKEKLYGEVILYITILIPMYVYGIINWLKNRDKKDNVVLVKGNLSKKEWLFMMLGLFLTTIGVFYLLKALGTAQLIMSTISFVSMLPALYLLARRCKWNQIAFLLNDVFVPIMWLVISIEENPIYISMVVTCVFQLIYDIYGMFEWIKLEKSQQKQSLEK